MPTLSTAKIPIPQSWDEFEKIALSSLKIKWQSPNLQRYGRQGQSQNGVDIYGEDNLGRHVGVQCKNYAEIDLPTIEEEINKAEGYKPKLDSYYMAVALPNDVKLQQNIRLTSIERINTNKFPVGIFFWEDLIDELAKNPEAFQAHYPQFKINSEEANGNPLSIFDISYYGNKLKEDVELLFGEFGWMAGEDPLQIRTISLILQNCAIGAFSDTKSDDFIKKVKEIESQCLMKVSSEEENNKRWSFVNNLITEVTQEITSLVYNYRGQNLATYQLGKELSFWSKYLHEKYSVNTEGVLKYFTAIGVGEPTLNKIEGYINAYTVSESMVDNNVNFNKVYSLAKRNIVALQINT